MGVESLIRDLEARVESAEEAAAELARVEAGLLMRFQIPVDAFRTWLLHELAAERVVEDLQIQEWLAALAVVVSYEEESWVEPSPVKKALLTRVLVLQVVRRCGPLTESDLIDRVQDKCASLARWSRWGFNFAIWAGGTVSDVLHELRAANNVVLVPDPEAALTKLRLTPRGVRHLQEIQRTEAAPWSKAL